ncbi:MULTISPECIES: DUF6113 family protein [Mumia]|uniref:DUF6113 family protein n=1 Tax=Mumia TaxID=1546255 RepID=UPI001424894D|nr:DUF6113 family protein [Mumia sp. ZJ430]
MTSSRARGRSRLALAWVAAAVLGAVLAVAGLAVHRHVDAGLPWGLVLALAAAFFATRAAGMLGGRAAAVALAAGYGAVLALTMSSRPEGDYLVAADALGYSFLLGAIAVLGIAVVLSVSGARHTSPGPAGHPRTLGS